MSRIFSRKPVIRKILLSLSVSAPLLSACSQAIPTPETPRLKPECGIASYYHHTLSGEVTANGETYEPSRLTAAHKELEFGAVIRVLRRDTDDEVVVTINDRGPFIEGRIIDLSRAAARKIGIYGEEGIADVCLMIVRTSSDA